MRARRRGLERQVDRAHRDLDAARGRRPPPTIDDVSRDGAAGRIHLEADVARGTIFLDARPPDTLNLNRAGAPPVLFLPANLRSRTLVAPATGAGAADVAELFQPPPSTATGPQPTAGSRSSPGMERLLASNLRHFVLLIEEPELYLSPHAQRHLYGLLRALAQAGNQILYSTHAPVFLSVDKLEELALVRHTADRRHLALPARAAGGGRERSARSRSSTATAPSSSSRAARCSSRGAPRS